MITGQFCINKPANLNILMAFESIVHPIKTFINSWVLDLIFIHRIDSILKKKRLKFLKKIEIGEQTTNDWISTDQSSTTHVMQKNLLLLRSKI